MKVAVGLNFMLTTDKSRCKVQYKAYFDLRMKTVLCPKYAKWCVNRICISCVAG
jgi:nitrate reductase assembly molybdenum cofactor insertion protein NarJ